MLPGIYRGIESNDYHKGPGISKSGLDLVRRSPAHYAHAISAANDNERQPTPAQAFGSAFHALVLEPKLFVRDYCLALRPADVPEAIEDREVLVAMIHELNSGRKPKIPSTGSKAEQVARIIDAKFGGLANDEDAVVLDAMSGKELKGIIDALNVDRQGLLPVSGSRHELAEILRANGKPVTLWSDVLAEWMKNNAGRQVLTQEQWDALHGMRDAVLAHPAARALLTGCEGEAELSCYWQETVAQGADRIPVLLRGRPDFWRKDGIIVDLKSTEDAGPEEFARSIANWRYHVQHPIYLDGTAKALNAAQAKGQFKDWQTPRAFVFIAVEKKPPYAVGVYTLDEESVALGRAEYKADVRTYAQCLKSNQFPAYSPKIQNISLPAWQFARAAAANPTPA
jgi:exodeoxyribonuclease VIII